MKWKLFLTRFLLPLICATLIISPPANRFTASTIGFVIVMLMIITINVRMRFYNSLSMDQNGIAIVVSNAFFQSEKIIVPWEAINTITVIKGSWAYGKKSQLVISSEKGCRKILLADEKEFQQVRRQIEVASKNYRPAKNWS